MKTRALYTEINQKLTNSEKVEAERCYWSPWNMVFWQNFIERLVLPFPSGSKKAVWIRLCVLVMVVAVDIRTGSIVNSCRVRIDSSILLERKLQFWSFCDRLEVKLLTVPLVYSRTSLTVKIEISTIYWKLQRKGFIESKTWV